MVYNCEFVTFPLVPWVRGGTISYRFLIFAPLLTLKKKTHSKQSGLSETEKRELIGEGKAQALGAIQKRLKMYNFV